MVMIINHSSLPLKASVPIVLYMTVLVNLVWIYEDMHVKYRNSNHVWSVIFIYYASFVLSSIVQYDILKTERNGIREKKHADESVSAVQLMIKELVPLPISLIERIQKGAIRPERTLRTVENVVIVCPLLQIDDA